MKLIFGLGNPGDKYRSTKHNIGFITVDEMAFQMGITFNKSQFNSAYAEGRIGSEKVLLIKPLTFMNLSGESVRPWVDYYDLDESEDIVVIYDDMDLDVGRVRLREKGGHGGHNGMRSIIQHLGTKDFNRIKIGIGRPKLNQSVVSHVISKFPKEEHDDMQNAVNHAYDALRAWAEGMPFQEVMSKYN